MVHTLELTRRNPAPYVVDHPELASAVRLVRRREQPPPVGACIVGVGEEVLDRFLERTAVAQELAPVETLPMRQMVCIPGMGAGASVETCVSPHHRMRRFV